MALAQPVVTLTLNPSADISVEVNRWRPGEKLRAKVVRWDPGGGGLNVARVMRALGLDCLAIHTAGGPEGDKLHHAPDRGLRSRQHGRRNGGQRRQRLAVDLAVGVPRPRTHLHETPGNHVLGQELGEVDAQLILPRP